MKIKLDSDILASNIKTMQRLVQAQTIAFEAKGSMLYLTGTGNGNSCLLSVPCKVEDKKGTSAFNVDTNSILGAVAKRKEITLTIDEANVTVASGRYNAELLIHQYEKIEVVPDAVKSEKGLKLKDSFLKEIRGVLPKIELKPLLAMTDYVPIGIQATKEGTFIACYDSFQSAFYSNKELKGNVEFLLPSNVFTMIAREIKDQDYNMAVTDTAIYAFNDMFELALARPQQEGDQIPLEQAIGLYQELKKRKNDFVKLVIKTEGIKSLLENGKAIYEKDSSFTFKAKGDKCQLTLKSSFGTIKDMVKLDEEVSKDIEFTCDFSFFAALLEKAPATLELRVSKEMLLFTNKPVTYLLSLV